MQGILDWGVNVILWLQQFSPALDLPFRVFTFLGEEDFILLLVPLIFWCVERRVGARMVILFLFSTYLNSVAKIVAAQPRPFEYDERVRAIVEATGGGLPSGHAQSTVVVWGFLAAKFRRTWLWIVAGLLMVFVPLSRVYLGVHFPTDVLGGCLIGALLLVGYLWLQPRAEALLEKGGLAWQLGLAVVVPLVLLVIMLPVADDSIISAMGVLLGGGVGLALERQWVRFASGGVWWKQVLRLALGVAVVFALRFGLKAAFGDAEPLWLFRLVRYTVMGLWFSLGAPWAFVKIGLAGRETR